MRVYVYYALWRCVCVINNWLNACVHDNHRNGLSISTILFLSISVLMLFALPLKWFLLCRSFIFLFDQWTVCVDAAKNGFDDDQFGTSTNIFMAKNGKNFCFEDNDTRNTNQTHHLISICSVYLSQRIVGQVSAQLSKSYFVFLACFGWNR